MLGQKGGQNVGVAGLVGQAHDAAFGDIAHLGHSHGQVVHSDGQDFAVEIAPGEDGDFLAGVINKNERVIGDRVQFDINHPAGVSYGVTDRPVDLGNAAQGIGVLHIGGVMVTGEIALRQ